MSDDLTPLLFTVAQKKGQRWETVKANLSENDAMTLAEGLEGDVGVFVETPFGKFFYGLAGSPNTFNSYILTLARLCS